MSVVLDLVESVPGGSASIVDLAVSQVCLGVAAVGVAPGAGPAVVPGGLRQRRRGQDLQLGESYLDHSPITLKLTRLKVLIIPWHLPKGTARSICARVRMDMIRL